MLQSIANEISARPDRQPKKITITPFTPATKMTCSLSLATESDLSRGLSIFYSFLDLNAKHLK